MIENETNKHEGNDCAQDANADKHAILLIQVLKNDPFICSEHLTIFSSEGHLHQAISLYYRHEAMVASENTICAYHCVQS